MKNFNKFDFDKLVSPTTRAFIGVSIRRHHFDTGLAARDMGFSPACQCFAKCATCDNGVHYHHAPQKVSQPALAKSGVVSQLPPFLFWQNLPKLLYYFSLHTYILNLLPNVDVDRKKR